MKTSFLLENLLEKLSFLNHAVSGKTQLPALTGFLFKAEKGGIKISATDLEIGAVVQIPASTDEEGEVLLPAKTTTELLQGLKEERVGVEKQDGRTVFFGKRTRVSLNNLNETEFPKIYEERGEKLVALKKTDFSKSLLPVVFAASQDPARPALSAVYIGVGEKGAVVVATDSHRLSKNRLLGSGEKNNKDGPILVSPRTIRAILSNKNEEDIEIFVSKKNNQIIFFQGKDVLAGRVIGAEYPDFEKIIPAGHESLAEFDKNEALSALKTVSIFARENANIIKLSLKKGRVGFFAKSPTLGEENSEIEAKTEGEENEIAFNGRYLLDLLQNIEEETVVFEMQGPLNPGVFKIKGNNDFIHLIMPIRVKEEEI